ncbi:tRNA1(Val) (adenine(37)-N6)-methyltransferase [Bacteroides caecigallinarum]|uniref:tRNA1(Val) (adenine(37)-N6)-methyltransferase n=1 Tax=Bacteroides caecigallinarum TaxID=1411144 RepID=UPI001F3FC84D|nr:methyltransferase [Bacteroides caecigallinarum]MCF2581663.1 methyltransferase [Bacteroides caecigallinarum]
MKVGTDGVLLGAWTDPRLATKIADIGTGTGLIAIMLAQKSNASVTGIEIDTGAATQAKENMSNTLWKDRLNVIEADIKDYYPHHEAEFDLIVSNPPFFNENTKGYSEKRNIARHTDGLSFGLLVEAVSFILKEDGRFSVIIPATSAQEFISEAIRHKLSLTRKTEVITKLGTPAKRVMMEFCKNTSNNATTECSQLLLSENGNKSQEYINLTSDFYL